MDCSTLLMFACMVVTVRAWSSPFYPVRRVPVRVVRYAPPPHHRIPAPARPEIKWERPKRDHDYDHDHDHDSGHDHKNTNGVTGPVHTFVKTDKNANYKWGVRHHVGNQFAS